MYQNKVTLSLASIHRPGNSATTVKRSITCKTCTSKLQRYESLIHAYLQQIQMQRTNKCDQILSRCTENVLSDCGKTMPIFGENKGRMQIMRVERHDWVLRMWQREGTCMN